MIRQWLIRVGLTIGAFFVGSIAAFFLLFLITWDQGMVDFFTIAVGLNLAAVTFLSTRHITQPVVEPYKPHHKRLALAYAITMSVAGVLIAFAAQPWWQIALLAAASAGVCLTVFARGRSTEI